MDRTIVLFRKAKLFYKVYKILGKSALTGYSHSGSAYYPAPVDDMVDGSTFQTTVYPLVGWLIDKDMIL